MTWWRDILKEQLRPSRYIIGLGVNLVMTKVDVDEIHEDGYCEGCLEYCEIL